MSFWHHPHFLFLPAFLKWQYVVGNGNSHIPDLYIYLYRHICTGIVVYLYKCFHLSVSEFAMVVLTLVRFTLTKGVGVCENYVRTCVNKKTSPFHDSVIIYKNQHMELALQ